MNSKSAQRVLIQSLIKTVLNNSLAQAIIRIAYTPRVLVKVYLSVFVIVSSGMAAYMVINAILMYFSYDVITTSRNVFEIPTLFPAITICNANMFTTEYALGFLKEVNAELYPEISVFDADQTTNMSSATLYELFYVVNIVAGQRVISKNFTDAMRKQLGHSLTDIVKDCSFNYVACTPNDFVWHFDPYLGNCYTFNSGLNATSRQANVAGPFYGLHIEFYAKFHANLTEFNSYVNNYFNNYNGYGAWLFVGIIRLTVAYQ